VAFLVVLVIAVVVVVLVMRAAAAAPGGGPRVSGAQRRPRPRRQARFVAPDDDPDFLRELERRTRRDDA
jgi:hypothetical protein